MSPSVCLGVSWAQENQDHSHCLVDLLRRELPVDLLHRLARPLHRRKGFPVDVGRLDGVDLLFKGADLSESLVERVFMLLLPSQRRLRRCHVDVISTAVRPRR